MPACRIPPTQEKAQDTKQGIRRASSPHHLGSPCAQLRGSTKWWCWWWCWRALIIGCCRNAWNCSAAAQRQTCIWSGRRVPLQPSRVLRCCVCLHYITAQWSTSLLGSSGFDCCVVVLYIVVRWRSMLWSHSDLRCGIVACYAAAQ